MATIHKTILRHKRCILVYLTNRLEKIENAFWEFGLNLPKEYVDYLNEKEKNHLRKYKELVLRYSQSLDMELDLTKVRQKQKLIMLFLVLGFGASK